MSVPDATSEIYVRDVIERNDCAGKKQFFITPAEKEDEFIRPRYRLTRAWMFPHEKLSLACVMPMDKVVVNHQYIQNDLLVVGDFIQNLSDTGNRQALCRCQTPMVCDGFDLYCPNPQCGLTLAARIEQLGNTMFAEPIYWSYNEQRSRDEVHESVNNYLSYYQPFSVITQGLFWGQPGGSLEHILLNRDFGHISLATFLVEPLFMEFLEKYPPADVLDNLGYQNIYNFYADMNHLINRRDFEDDRQNILLHAFMQSLGIESLNHNHVRSMMSYEHNMGGMMPPLLVYAYLLTNPAEMMTALNLHRLEALAIFSEVKRRSHELFDIFYYYTQQNEDVIECFKKLV